MIIKIVRHGESDANIGIIDPAVFPDSKIRLTEKGVNDALSSGEEIGSEFLLNAQLYRSPYYRTRETSIGIQVGANCENHNLVWKESPLLREIEVGHKDRINQEELRATIGWFYYRFEQGESPADLYTRLLPFVKDIEKKNENTLIVCHGMTMRVLIMLFANLSVEQFELMKNPENGDVSTIYTQSSLNLIKQEEKEKILFENREKNIVVCSNIKKYTKEHIDFDKVFRERALNIKKNR